jgi:hypothetical protein
MKVQHGNSQQVLDDDKYIIIYSIIRLGSGDLENLTYGSESRKYIN